MIHKTVRLPAAMWQQVADLARQEHRSMNGQLMHMVAQQLAAARSAAPGISPEPLEAPHG